MKCFKILMLCVLVGLMCFGSITSFAAYSVNEFGIENIEIPENYISCTRDACDPELETIISQSGFTGLDDWTAKVMTPGNYYVYACNKNDLTKCMYLVCEKLDSPKTKDKLVTHKHARDYNLAKSAADKAELLDDTKRAAGVNDAAWVTPNDATSYIEYYPSVGEDRIHRYETIYNGNKISLQFSSKKDFTKQEKETHYSILASIKHSESVDYTEIEEQISSARQKKLEEDTNTGENTKILRYIIGASVAFVIAFSIYMAIRSQNKKRRKTIVLREHEVTDDDAAGLHDDNQNNTKGDK